MSAQPPKRDKFASLQASRTTSSPTNASQSPTPKRDKFASMAARQQTGQGPDVSPLAGIVAPAPKRDKFASMAARQQGTSPIPSASSQASGRNRDKFSSMAARQQSSPSQAPQPDDADVLTAITASGATPVASVPKRDKFASMAQGTTAPKRDKLASLAQQQNPQIPAVAPVEPKPSNENQMKQLKKRTQQRQRVLAELERAEGHTWNLIQLASQTAKNLTELKVNDEEDTLSDISSKYRDTLQRIHSLLSPHAKFVKAYQNHQETSDASNMYAARVEKRLAQERRYVLEELLSQEKQEAMDIANTNKRKHEKTMQI